MFYSQGQKTRSSNLILDEEYAMKIIRRAEYNRSKIISAPFHNDSYRSHGLLINRQISNKDGGIKLADLVFRKLF